MKDVLLHKTEWLSLRKLVDPSKGVNGYVYSHEDRCNGKIVSILPYRKVDGNFEYLLRNEITPCWGMSSKVSSITGGVEDYGVIKTVINEMKEESGYEVIYGELEYHGTINGTKSTDTTYYLYTVDLTNKDQKYDASGDGSELEKQASCFWSSTIKNADDPFLYVLYYKLHNSLK